ncbi:MAG: carboxypeptidase regulatory-like domain-containing protein, partial [Desulfatitalea sp.]|nr:carboxypeptidase-like regulatory domain-containing protein [Desulfatitalea sp.]NNJ99829.1 carboxypeptidase regulatory-like domain-containing protein [Desulfatitalea sp.]
MPRSIRLTTFWLATVTLCILIGLPTARAGVNDVLFGAANSQTMIDFSQITDEAGFNAVFTYNTPPTSSLTIGGNIEAQIGAMWTGGQSPGEWQQVRVIIDSNGDGDFTPFDYSDPTHPWNPPTLFNDKGYKVIYTYPDDYPRSELRGEQITITLTMDQYGGWYTDFPWDTWEQWWYEGDADKTDNWWMENDQLMNIWWSGRDQNWNMLPNGDYKMQVWVDENNDGQFADTEANKSMVITVETASITGTVQDASQNPVSGARVEAGSHMAWGESRTRSDGTFTISGLQASSTENIEYHLRVQADGKVTHESQPGQVMILAGQTTADAGTITMSDAVTISGTIKLDRDADGVLDETEDQFEAFTNQWGWEQMDMWVWVDGHNMQGPGWGNADARFEVGQSGKSFSINIPPPANGSAVYRLNVHAEGYVATLNGQPLSGADIAVDANGGNAGTIVLTKASRLYGTVRLPAAIDTWNHIDVQAISNANSDVRYWGWGNIDPYRDGGTSTDTGTFQIDGIPEGTYRLEVRVMGYAIYAATDVVVAKGTDKDMGELTISEGSKINGTLTIGDTTELQRWYGDTGTEIDIWIDAWSHSGGWSGTNLRITRGAAQTVNYSLAGLSDATYEVNCWLGEGFELVDTNGNSPVFVTVSGATTANLELRPYEGIIQGTISTSGVTVDMNTVVIEVQRPWDWLPPKTATVANGKLNATTGAYAIGGLGTGDYVVKAGAYTGYFGGGGGGGGETPVNLVGTPSDLNGYAGEGYLIPDPGIGVSLQRTFVQNDANNPTTMNVTLQRGYSITGTVALSQTDPPWHDFGDGNFDTNTQSFGAANGRKDKNDPNPLLSEAIGMVEDIAGQPVMAMPMEMMFMGGMDPRMGMIQYDNGSGIATYQINGLAPGVYMIQPPFSSRRITNYEYTDMGDAAYYSGDQQTHHWTATTRMVVITDDDVTGADFIFANGYTVTGQITLPEAQTYTEDWQAWNWVGQLELETAQHQFMGHGKPLMKRDFNQGSRYSFTFNHVANGDYMVRFWTDRFVPGGAKFTVNNGNATVNITIEDGANLVGKLVDADTGEAVTA